MLVYIIELSTVAQIHLTAGLMYAGPGARWHLPQCLSLLAPSNTTPIRTVNHGL